MTTNHSELLNMWKVSGLTQKDFCAAHGITLGKFLYARQQELSLSKNKSSLKFTKMEIQEVEDEVPFTIVFPGGARLELVSLTAIQLKELLL